LVKDYYTADYFQQKQLTQTQDSKFVISERIFLIAGPKML